MIGLRVISREARRARPIAVHQASVSWCQQGWNAVLTSTPPRFKVPLFDRLGVEESLASACQWGIGLGDIT